MATGCETSKHRETRVSAKKAGIAAWFFVVLVVVSTTVSAGGMEKWLFTEEDPRIGPGLCVQAGGSLYDCRGIETGQALCMRGGAEGGPRTAELCRDVSVGQALCARLPEQTLARCKGATVGEAYCMKLGRTREKCRSVTLSQALCLEVGHALADCRGAGF